MKKLALAAFVVIFLGGCSEVQRQQAEKDKVIAMKLRREAEIERNIAVMEKEKAEEEITALRAEVEDLLLRLERCQSEINE